jgi:hypothetical protein
VTGIDLAVLLWGVWDTMVSLHCCPCPALEDRYPDVDATRVLARARR